jgi:hypothetical protein
VSLLLVTYKFSITVPVNLKHYSLKMFLFVFINTFCLIMCSLILVNPTFFWLEYFSGESFPILLFAMLFMPFYF